MVGTSLERFSDQKISVLISFYSLIVKIIIKVSTTLKFSYFFSKLTKEQKTLKPSAEKFYNPGRDVPLTKIGGGGGGMEGELFII